MKIINFKQYKDFADIICENLCEIKDEYGSIVIIALYHEAKQVITSCIERGFEIASVQIDNTEYGDYFDEYIITVDQEGLWCEPFKRNGKYIFASSNVLFIFDNCNSKVIECCEADLAYEVCTDGCYEEHNDENISCNCGCDEDCQEEHNKCMYERTDDDLFSVSFTCNKKDGKFETLSYTTSDKSSLNTMLDKIKDIVL